jgi:ABC-type transport system involved in multi-copper enzyme maturation permease subunit
MWKALALKEIRDVAPVACIALLAYLAGVAGAVGYPVFGRSGVGSGIPFLDSVAISPFIFFSVVFTAGLGFWQTVKESSHGTWLFLLHRPANRKTLIAMKLAVGFGTYLLISAGAIVLYSIWAAAPGTHASPFAWWMTVPVWKTWLTISLVYLGAFLSGLRPGRWFGTRLLPGLTIALAAVVVGLIFLASSVMGGTLLIAFGALCVGLVFYVARVRDFS